ncbi:alpha/beta hydrolase [Paenibacillus sp.]|uniref:alpha/beta hydrolase n=1 Tax=Paenibacillus sp. TaxID=58172 RepID=UPI002D63057A|nr:alpha/beta hydrolase-fold protein [Paenibacillus sp.]HZG87846.1 alpha/beta hydrolase-fold protein [Paenibacillus sp.]
MAWLRVHFHSETLRMPTAMEVLLPQRGEGPRMTVDLGPYPTLYLLHDLGEDQTAWMRRSSIERYAEGRPLAVVMPAGHRSWYADMAFGRNYSRFIAEELPAFCERMYPLSNLREHRYVAGCGMGGFGAVTAALRAPERFALAASFSGALDAAGAAERLPPELARDVFGDEGRSGSSDAFAAAQALSATNRPRPDIALWCGIGDPVRDDNVRFRDSAASLGLTVVYEEGPGEPGWASWDRCVERLIDRLAPRVPVRQGGTSQWR